MQDSAPNPARGNGPWRVLLLDRSADDPKWLLATVALPGDIRPAELDRSGRYTDWLQAAAWVTSHLGHQAVLMPITNPLAWLVDKPELDGKLSQAESGRDA